MTTTSHPAAREGVRRLSVAHFLVALAVWIVAAPFLNQLPYSEMLESALLTVVLLTSTSSHEEREP